LLLWNIADIAADIFSQFDTHRMHILLAYWPEYINIFYSKSLLDYPYNSVKFSSCWMCIQWRPTHLQRKDLAWLMRHWTNSCSWVEVNISTF